MDKKYFLGLERQHQCHNVIKELKSNEENVSEGKNAILGEMITYYQKLYTTQIFLLKKSMNTHRKLISQNLKNLIKICY